MVAIVVAAMVDIVVANLMVAVSSIVMVTTVVSNLDSVYSSNESCKSEGLVHFVSRLTLICENMS